MNRILHSYRIVLPQQCEPAGSDHPKIAAFTKLSHQSSNNIRNTIPPYDKSEGCVPGGRGGVNRLSSGVGVGVGTALLEVLLAISL